ncbi:MAG: prepilin peptidase [Clostridiales bacterium]|jgi:leader peptidase (prepilin peptidase)/N-methyltransferase|nr:prepilin peptidase [Clostridiales bacterium]
MDTIEIIISTIFSIAIGLFAGLTVIYIFNRIPAKWLCDYDEEPDKGMWGERIKKKPWQIVFALVFVAISVKLMYQGYQYQIAGLIAIWLLLQIGIADKKYMIIPDQFVIALAVTALGFIYYHPTFLSPLYGALIGGGSLLLIGIIGKLILKKEAMGFGDVKLMCAVGLISGIKGTLVILVLTIISSGLIFGIGLLLRLVKRDEEQPLGPFISASAALYLLFIDELNLAADFYLSLY